jgi:hypothetical protein
VRRDRREDLAVDQAVPFEQAQGLGEHLLGDAFDRAVQFGEPQGAAFEGVQDQQAPPVADPVHDLPGRAGLGEHVVAAVG